MRERERKQKKERIRVKKLRNDEKGIEKMEREKE